MSYVKTKVLYDGDTFTHDGLTFRVTFPQDDISEAPWERDNGHGHGPVSEWRANGYDGNRNKRAGEMVICTDGSHARFYDYEAACKTALADGWGYDGKSAEAWVATGLMTRKGAAAMAALEDFNRLRRWCNDEWFYVGVVVELLDDEGEPMGETEATWGIESDADDYLAETAHELAGEIIARLQSIAA